MTEKSVFTEAEKALWGQLGLLQLRLSLLEDAAELELFAEIIPVRQSLILVATAIQDLLDAVGDEFVHNDELHEALCDNPPETRW
jgi:hypothetical protein